MVMMVGGGGEGVLRQRQSVERTRVKARFVRRIALGRRLAALASSQRNDSGERGELKTGVGSRYTNYALRAGYLAITKVTMTQLQR